MATEYYTPNFASDADRIAPIIASRDVAAGIYIWLHSRVYVSHNDIGVSEAQLAEIMGCKRSSIHRTIKFLVDSGLIEHESHRGNGGGSRFRVLGLNGACVQPLGEGKCSTDAAFNDASTHSNAACMQHQTRRARSITNKGDTEDKCQNKSRSPYDY